MPKLVAGVDVALQPLHPFEAYILSLLDGAHSVHELAQLAALRDVEVGAVLRSLLDNPARLRLDWPPCRFRANHSLLRGGPFARA